MPARGQTQWGPEGPEGWGPEGWGPEGWGPEGGPKGGGPKGGGPKGGGPKGGGPKISRFFSPLPPQNSFFSSLSGGLLVEFWWCLKRRGGQMCTFGVLWLSCEARSGGAAGVSHDSPRAQTCTFEGPGLQKHNQNSTKRHPEREEKNEFCGGRGKKKSEILGGPGEGRSRGRAVQGKGGPGEGRSQEGRSKPNLETNTHT